jgi:hypothetical protein
MWTRSTGLLTKNRSSAMWFSHATSTSAASGCGPVAEYQDVDRPELVGHGSDEVGDLAFVGDVGREAPAVPPASLMVSATSSARPSAPRPVDGDGKAVAGKANREDLALPSGTPGHERHTLLTRQERPRIGRSFGQATLPSRPG